MVVAAPAACLVWRRAVAHAFDFEPEADSCQGQRERERDVSTLVRSILQFVNLSSPLFLALTFPLRSERLEAQAGGRAQSPFPEPRVC